MDEETQKAEQKKLSQAVLDVYDGDEEEAKYAVSTIERINKALELREQSSLVTNGVPYSQAYVYNQAKAINYAPPKDPKDDREVSMGMVHEKIVAFIAIFLKYVFKRRFKCYNGEGKVIRGMGDIYDLAVEYSYKLEKFKEKVALIYWEVFAQGNAFVFEDWEVKTVREVEAYKDGKKVNEAEMDYTYEFLDGLEYKDAKEQVQVRRAVARVLDGRQVIFGNPEIEDLQEQPFIAIEHELDSGDAEAMFGTLGRYKAVPTDRDTILSMTEHAEKFTLFDAARLTDPDKKKLAHYFFDKENNRFNIYLNGVMLLSRKTPFRIFYPRGNYPLSNFACERLRGSIYARSIPAKTKFNADFIDWALKNLALKFEQGVIPAILSKSKFTLTRDMFRAGQVTQGVSATDFEKADPENKGVTQAEFSFVDMLKQLVESQTLNPTAQGEVTGGTATELSLADAGQREKLGFLLDGLILGYMDLAMRRAETIESKYTTKQRETVVDGKTINVYQNFTVSMDGADNVVEWDEEVGSEDYDEEGKRDEMFQKAFKDKQQGYPTHYYLINPDVIRQRKHVVDVEILPERIKDTQLQLMGLWEEMGQLMATFQNLNQEELQKMYLDVSGRSDKLFLPAEVAKLDQAAAAAQGGAQGQPAQPKTIQGKALMNR